MGLGSIIGGLIGGPWAAVGGAVFDEFMADDKQSSAEQYSSAEAAKNREFQERMSNTAYQRGVKDMQAAGLNPMLAYSQGPAGVPGGSAASYPGAVGAQYKTAEASQVSASASASQAVTAASVGSATIGKIKQEISTLSATEDQVKAVTRNLAAEYHNLLKTGENLESVNKKIMMEINKMGHEIPLIRSQQFLNEMRSLLTEADTALRGSQKRLVDVDVRAAESFGELGKTVGVLEPFIRLLQLAFPRR